MVLNGIDERFDVLVRPLVSVEGLHDVFTQRPIGLELRFAEHLVGGRLVRKRRVGFRIGAHRSRLGAAIAWLDVEKMAGRGVLRIDNPRYRDITAGLRGCLARGYLQRVEFYLDVEIDRYPAHRVAQI